MGKKMLDPDVFSAGETSAIGVECTMVLAGLSVDQPNSLIDAVLAQDRAWLTSTIVRRYKELISSWQDADCAKRVLMLRSDLSKLMHVTAGSR